MFDVEQCRKDGWRCECQSDKGVDWSSGWEYCGTYRDGSPRVRYNGNAEQEVYAIRNLPKKAAKIRGTAVATVSSAQMGDSGATNYHLAVPWIANGAGFPVIDHSDAILEVLERINCCMEPQQMLNDEVERIKRERGE